MVTLPLGIELSVSVCEFLINVFMHCRRIYYTVLSKSSVLCESNIFREVF